MTLRTKLTILPTVLEVEESLQLGIQIQFARRALMTLFSQLVSLVVVKKEYVTNTSFSSFDTIFQFVGIRSR